MKCPDLHRNVRFPYPYLHVSAGGVEGSIYKSKNARNWMKYSDLHRKIIFPNSLPSWGEGQFTKICLINFIQYNKTEFTFVHRKAFVNVNANSASLGLRENVTLTNLVPKCHRKIWHQCWCGGRGEAPGRTILARWFVCVHLVVGGAQVGLMGCRIGGYHYKQRASISCSTHPRCVAADTFQGSCIGGIIDWWTWPPLWSWGCPGTPYPLWRSRQIWWNDLKCWHDHKWGRGL